MHARHGNFKTYSLVLAVLDHDAHVESRRLPAFAMSIDVPTAIHQQVRSEDSAAGKMNEQPFSARFDLIDRLANERRVIIESHEERKRRPEADDRLAQECAADIARGAKDGVAFRHFFSC